MNVLSLPAVFFFAAALATLSPAQQEPWSPAEVIEPDALAHTIQGAHAPVVVSVAFPVLYRNRHILHALDAGAGSKPEGIAALKELVAGKPKSAELVIYCGCCPMVKCPNIRPAYRALKDLGFTNVRVVDIPTNMHQDWYSKNYPSEAGRAASGPGQ